MEGAGQKKKLFLPAGKGQKGIFEIASKTFAAVVALVVILTAAAAIRSPMHTLSLWEKGRTDSLLVSRELFPKKARLAYLENLISLAGEDSIVMAVNLPDSLISLLLKGVEVHRTKITAMKLDPLLKNMSPQGLMSLTDSVFQVSRSEGSILKAPIVYKKAPKDTAEANRTPDSIPAPRKETVWFTLIAGPLELHFRQSDALPPGEAGKQLRRDLSRRWKAMKSWISSAFPMETVPYSPRITMEMTAEEATMLYRALPVKPQIVLKLTGRLTVKSEK